MPGSGRSGPLDLVTAVNLLNYAESKDQMLSMFCSAYDSLVPGGRFVAYTINPDFTLAKPNNTKYGVTVLREEPEEGRYACEAEFITDPPFLVWYPSEVAPDDIAYAALNDAEPGRVLMITPGNVAL